MPENLYCSIADVSSILSCNVSASHSASTSTAIINCLSHSKNLNDEIEIDLGYATNHAVVFKGYVKQIERNIPDNIFTLTCSDVLTRALEYFFVSSSPETPFSRRDIKAEILVGDILAEAGLTNYGYTNTYFTFATGELAAEVSLISAYDYCAGIVDLLTWHLYADTDGKVWFINRKPFPMDGASGQPGDVADVSIGLLTDNNFLDFTYRTLEKDLRNRVVVWGATGISATAQAVSPYLPAGFYKSMALSSPIIATQSLAQDIADYNLSLYNKLKYEIITTVLGDPALLPRQTINITNSHTGITDEEFYIFSSDMSWSRSGFTTSLQLTK